MSVTSTLSNTVNQMSQQLSQLFTKNIDMTGRRCINAGTSVNTGDYVTNAELTTLINRVAALEKKVGS